MKVTMNWDELVNSYNDYDNESFELYLCNQLGIRPDGCFEETPEGMITTDEAFEILAKMFSGKSFTVTPNAEHIRWRGKLNSDFRVSVNGGWKNSASAVNGKKGGRPRKK